MKQKPKRPLAIQNLLKPLPERFQILIFKLFSKILIKAAEHTNHWQAHQKRSERYKILNGRCSVVKTGAFIGGLIGVAVISVVTFSSMGYGEEPVKDYYQNGQLASERTYKRGQLDGAVKEFYLNGKPKSEMLYENGTRQGPFKTYYEDGQVKIEGFYKNGRLDRMFKEYYANGKSKADLFYKNGNLEGHIREYYENGQLRSTRFYRDGIEGKMPSEYDDKGDFNGAGEQKEPTSGKVLVS